MDPNDFVIWEDELLIAQSSQPTPRLVQSTLGLFNIQGELIVAHSDFPEPMSNVRYTQHASQNTGGVQNHLQGVERIADTNYLAVSGSNWKDGYSDILLYDIQSTVHDEYLLSNVYRDKTPPEEDSFHYVIRLQKPPKRPDGTAPFDRILWHGGGMDSVGKILAIPLEHDPEPTLDGLGRIDVPKDLANSAIRFLDFTDIQAPKLFEEGITRDFEKAGAVAVTRLNSGHYICGVWSDSDHLSIRLDLYISESTVFDGRFKHGSSVVSCSTYRDSSGTRNPFTQKYQSTNFVHKPDGIYFLGFHKVDGQNMMDEYIFIQPNEDTPNAEDQLDLCFLKFIKSHFFNTSTNYANMQAVSGSYVSNKGNLTVFAGAEWKRSNKLYITEYHQPLRKPQILRLNNSFIEFYKKDKLKERTFTLYNLTGDRDSISNFKDVYTHEKNFNDKTWTIRHCMPKSATYELYEDHNHKKIIRKLSGTGEIDIVSLESTDKEKKLSSSKLE